MSRFVVLLCVFLACAHLVAAGWEDCRLCDVPGQDGKFNNEIANERDAECRSLDVPVDWSNYFEDDRRLDLFVKRYTTNAEAAASLFVIGGQPGESHIAAEREVIPMLLGGIGDLVDVYSVDIRGIGQSSNIDCPRNTTIAQCNEYLRQKYGPSFLQKFSITNAAFDLVYLINKIREETEVREIWVYAYGFGTILMNRFFQIDKQLVDAAVFDSVPSLDPFYFSSHDSDANEVGLRFLEGCDLSAYCNAQVHGSPRRTLQDIYLRNVTCFPSYLDEPAVKRLFTLMLYERKYQPLIAPLIKRADRCNDDDRDRIARLSAAIIKEYTTRYPPYDTNERSRTAAFQYTISELYTPTSSIPNLDQLRDSVHKLLFADYRSIAVATIWQNWAGRYTPDSFWKKFPNTTDEDFVQLPIVIFGPEFDALDNPKFGQLLNFHYQKRYFSFERGSHNALIHSRTRSGPTCGFQILKQLFFSFNHTLKDADLRCLKSVEDIDYECMRKGCLEASLEYFGTTDAWGGKPTGTVEDAFDKNYYIDDNPFTSFYVEPSPSPSPSPLASASSLFPSLSLLVLVLLLSPLSRLFRSLF